MILKSNTDNRYQVGTLIFAKADPDRELVIKKYFQRIYYCTVVGQEDKAQLAFFERELIPPGEAQENGSIGEKAGNANKTLSK